MEIRSRPSRESCLPAPKQKPNPKRKPSWMTPRPPRGAKKRALLTAERLRDLYQAETELKYENPFQLLIETIISAQTTERSVKLVTPELLLRYPHATYPAAVVPEE